MAADVAFHKHIAITVEVRVAQPKKTFADAIDISPNYLHDSLVLHQVDSNSTLLVLCELKGTHAIG